MDVDEMAQKVGLERANFPHFFQPPPLPDGSATLSPIPHKPVEVISTGTAEVRTMGEVISPLTDVVMGNSAKHSRVSTSHQTLIVSGPPSPRIAEQEKTFSEWAERNNKRPLEGIGDVRQDKKSASSSSGPPIFQPVISGEQKISDAEFFVRQMGLENQELGKLLADENLAAQMAAQDYLQKSIRSEEQRQADLQQFRQMAEGLARAYHEQSEANRAQGMQANRELREEMRCYTRQYVQDEETTRSQVQNLSEAAVYWRAESEQEGRVAARHSEHSKEVAQRCTTAEQALRQSIVPNIPQNQAEIRGVISRVEQEAIQHVRANEQRTELQLEQSSQQARLLNEEIYAKNLGIHLATQRGDKAEADVARGEQLLAQEKVLVLRARHEKSETHAIAVQAQSKYVQTLHAMDSLQTEYGEALQSFQDEQVMYHEAYDQCYEENRLYVETYELWQNLRCTLPASPVQPQLPVQPPGLPASTRSFGGTNLPETRAPGRYEEQGAKIKEADKLHAPPYPTITNIASWQSNLTQALVQTSGFRVVETIIEWITKVWTKGAKFEDFSSSGGPEFVTLDVKLSTAMQLIVSHGGQDAKELKDLINRKWTNA